MKNIGRKILSFCLVFFCVFLVACGNTKDETPQQPTPPPNTEETVPETPTTPEPEPEPEEPEPVVCEHDYNLSELDLDKDFQTGEIGIYCCSKCDETKQEELELEDFGMPVINFTGSLEGISKENELKVSMEYLSEDLDFDCDIKIKVQGNSSAYYPKKNYTIKMYEKDTDYDEKYKVELVDGWGKENKYCLKANYVDFSHARNIVAAKVFGDIVHSREKDDEVDKLINGGGIDGYPVMVCHEGRFLGLYTMNIPKDSWLFDMEEDDPKDGVETKQAMLMADSNTEKAAFLEEIVDYDYVSSGYELEFCSTEETNEGTDWVADSFNDMIEFINNHDGASFKAGITEYLDIDRTIDCLIYTLILDANDNVAKNILWITYDGKKWFPSMYDLDSTWGFDSDGTFMQDAGVSMVAYFRQNELYDKLLDNYFDEVATRYNELRLSALSVSNIQDKFISFYGKIPDFIYSTDAKKWTETKNQDLDFFEYIMNFVDSQFEEFDEYFLIEE